jgi:hypothetical protein
MKGILTRLFPGDKKHTQETKDKLAIASFFNKKEEYIPA